MTKRPAEKKLGINQRELSLSFGNHYGEENANELYNMIFIRFIWRCVGFPRLCLVVTPWCFYLVFLCVTLLAYLSSYCISLFFPPNMDCQVGMERAILPLDFERSEEEFILNIVGMLHTYSITVLRRLYSYVTPVHKYEFSTHLWKNLPNMRVALKIT